LNSNRFRLNGAFLANVVNTPGMAIDAQSDVGKKTPTKTSTALQAGHQMVAGKFFSEVGEEF
jgi:hypothetical protein